jgi:hypothetical protein
MEDLLGELDWRIFDLDDGVRGDVFENRGLLKLKSLSLDETLY